MLDGWAVGGGERVVLAATVSSRGWLMCSDIGDIEERRRILSPAPLLQELVGFSSDRPSIQVLTDLFESGPRVLLDSGTVVAKNGSEVNALQQFLRHRSLGISEQQRLEEEGCGFTRQRTEKYGCLAADSHGRKYDVSSNKTGRPSLGPTRWNLGALWRPETATFHGANV